MSDGIAVSAPVATVSSLTREELVLRKIIDDPMIQVRIASHLEADLFDNPNNQLVVKSIHKFVEHYKRYPTAQELAIVLPDGPIKSQVLRISNSDVTRIEKRVSMDLVDAFFREKKTTNVLTSFGEVIYNKEWEGISDLIKELQNSVNFSMHIDMGINLVKDTDEALRRLSIAAQTIPSSIPEVNMYTAPAGQLGAGGWHKKAVSLFMGMPNVGKSILLCNEAAFAFQSGYNVAYISLEMAEEYIWERIAVNCSNIKLADIRTSNAEEIKEKLSTRTERGAKSPGNLWIRKMPTTATVIEFQSFLDEIWATEGIKIDMLVVDYLGIMKPTKRATTLKDQSLYTQGKDVAEQLRDLANANEIAVLSATQMTRGGYNNKEVGLEHVANSAGISDTVDFMITIMSDPMLRSMKMYLHYLLKNRFGPKDVSFVTSLDIDVMRVRQPCAEAIHKYSELAENQPQDTNPYKRKRPDKKDDKVPEMVPENTDKDLGVSQLSAILHGKATQDLI